MPKLDDLARDYVAAGITEEEDIYSCLNCGASVMPWYMRCEGCGKNPTTPPPEPQYLCTNCGEIWDSEDDAERCCIPEELLEED